MKRRYLVIVCFSAIFAGILLTHLLTRWWVFRTTGIYGGVFFDLQSVINSQKCFEQDGLDIYKYDPTASCVGGYMYGISLMYILSAILTVTSSTTSIAVIGLFITSLILGVIASVYWTGTKRSALFLVICLSSPGTWLLVERGNIDQIVLMLLFAASLLISKKKEFFGVLLIGISVLLKFYTFPLLLVVALIFSSKKLKAFTITLACILLPITAWNISLIHGFPSSWFVSFGAPIIPKFAETVGIFLPSLVSHTIGVLMLGVLVLIITSVPAVQRFRIGEKILTQPKELEEVLTFIFGVTFVSCYLSGTNYDYRLIYLATFGLGLLKNVAHTGYNNLFLAGPLIISLWCTDFFFGIHLQYAYGVWQFIGDIFLAVFVALVLQPIIPKLRRMDWTFSRN